jgi:hypothetical protein
LLNPYKLIEIDEYSYEFVTKKGIAYKVYFLDYSVYFSDFPDISKNIYTFNLDLKLSNKQTNIQDERIAETIAEVFRLFFTKNTNTVIYVCDSLDEKHFIRKRKFDSWFWKFNDGSIIKEDGIAVIEGAEILNSILIHKNNPNLTNIILAFNDLNNRAPEK